MARQAFYATLGQSLGSGQYSSSSGHNTPILTAATTADDAVATAQALEAAITTAQAAAEANATISGNGTALGLVQDIGTATAAYIAAVLAAKTATAAAKTAAAAKNVVVDYDTSVITTRNALRAALRTIDRMIDGSGLASG